MSADLLTLSPVPTLIERVRDELGVDFPPGRAVRVSRAPGRLDVMGGIADYTGSLVLEATLDRAAAVAVCSRDDRVVQVVSLNLLDENRPFTFRMPLDALAAATVSTLRAGFDEPGRKWAGYVVGCLFALHHDKLIDLSDPAMPGMNLAIFSTVPPGAGVSSSAALEVASMTNLADHLGIRKRLDPTRLAAMCQWVENQIVGAPCGIMDQMTSCLGEAGALLRMVCQPHEIGPPLPLPRGIRVVGINSGVKHSVGGGRYGRTRCAAFMGHAIVLERIRLQAKSAGHELVGDPLRGYLANLDPDDYKAIFRPHLPGQIGGRDFLARYGPTIDPATTVDPDTVYDVLQATDHHVLENRRVQNFAKFLDEADTHAVRTSSLRKAGHLMYASHLSYTNDAQLGAAECDVLVELIRAEASAGLYGARITGGGCGGTVAVLAENDRAADDALDRVITAYRARTDNPVELFSGSSAGAWQTGTTLVI